MAEDVIVSLHPAETKGKANKDDNGAGRKETIPDMKMSTRHMRVIGVAVLNLLVVNSAITFLVPFFTRTALDKMGVARDSTGTVSENFVIGCVLGISTFAEFLSAPLVAKDLANVCSKMMLVLSSLTITALMLLFSVLDKISDWRTFISLCLIIRTFQGVATAANYVSTYTITNASLQGKAGLTNGFLRTGGGLGYGIGPALGGILYDWEGFGLPFYVSGALLFSTTIMLVVALPASESEVCGTQMKKTFSYFQLLRIPWVWMVMAAAYLASLTIGFVEPSFTIYLRDNFNLPSAYAGYAFFLYCVVYAIPALPLGYFIDEYLDRSHAFLVQVLGLIFCAVGLLLVGPASFLPLEKSLALSYVSFALLALGVLSCLLPSSPELANTFQSHGLGSPAEIRAPIGGLYQASVALGYGCGPLLGSVAVASMGFKQATQLLGFVNLLYATLFLLAGIIGKVKDMNDLQLNNIVRGQ